MACNDYLAFRKIEHYGKPNILTNLEANLKHYFDWAFLKIGAWQDVDSNSYGIRGGNFSVLREVQDEGYDDYLVYHSIKKDWIYETGVNYCGPTVPITSINYNTTENQNQVFTDYYHNFESGVDVTINGNGIYNGNFEVIGTSGNESFYINLAESSGNSTGGNVYGNYNPVTPVIYSGGAPYNTGDYSINYPLGQVTFNIPQSGVNITADYSYRQVQTYLSDDVPWFVELQFDSFNPADKHWTQTANSGDFVVPAQHTIQMPAIIIDIPHARRMRGYEIGYNAGHIVNQNIYLHILTENKHERDNIVDILAEQQSDRIKLYDVAKVNNFGVYSLDYRGDRNPNGLLYPDLIGSENYKYKTIKINSATTKKIERISSRLYRGVVSWDIELIS